MSSRPGRMMAWRIVAAILTIVLVMAFVAAVSLYSPLSSWVDQARGDAGVPQTVGASQMEMYCPARMTLADAGGIAAQVVVMEPTGMDTFVACRHGSEEFSAVFRERHDFAPGTTIHLQPDLQRAHLFDAGTGQRLAA